MSASCTHTCTRAPESRCQSLGTGSLSAIFITGSCGKSAKLTKLRCLHVKQPTGSKYQFQTQHHMHFRDTSTAATCANTVRQTSAAESVKLILKMLICAALLNYQWIANNWGTGHLYSCWLRSLSNKKVPLSCLGLALAAEQAVNGDSYNWKPRLHQLLSVGKVTKLTLRLRF